MSPFEAIMGSIILIVKERLKYTDTQLTIFVRPLLKQYLPWMCIK